MVKAAVIGKDGRTTSTGPRRGAPGSAAVPSLRHPLLELPANFSAGVIGRMHVRIRNARAKRLDQKVELSRRDALRCGTEDIGCGDGPGDRYASRVLGTSRLGTPAEEGGDTPVNTQLPNVDVRL